MLPKPLAYMFSHKLMLFALYIMLFLGLEHHYGFFVPGFILVYFHAKYVQKCINVH